MSYWSIFRHFHTRRDIIHLRAFFMEICDPRGLQHTDLPFQGQHWGVMSEFSPNLNTDYSAFQTSNTIWVVRFSAQVVAVDSLFTEKFGWFQQKRRIIPKLHFRKGKSTVFSHNTNSLKLSLMNDWQRYQPRIGDPQLFTRPLPHSIHSLTHSHPLANSRTTHLATLPGLRVCVGGTSCSRGDTKGAFSLK